jgi:hypothetical protein
VGLSPVLDYLTGRKLAKEPRGERGRLSSCGFDNARDERGGVHGVFGVHLDNGPEHPQRQLMGTGDERRAYRLGIARVVGVSRMADSVPEPFVGHIWSAAAENFGDRPWQRREEFVRGLRVPEIVENGTVEILCNAHHRRIRRAAQGRLTTPIRRIPQRQTAIP